MEFEFDFPQPKSCRRCKKDFIDGDSAVRLLKQARGRKYKWNDRRFFNDGDAMFLACWYHKKCIPPNIFNKHFAGRAAPDTPVSL